MEMRTAITVAVALSCAFPCLADGAKDGGNLARLGKARSWLANSVESAPAALVNDGDPLSFWGSNKPTTDPPKDIGIEWEHPQTFAAIRVTFYSTQYAPAADGWRLEARRDGAWHPIVATVDRPSSSWWTLHFRPTTTRAVRLVVTDYVRNRPAVQEFEVYRTDVPRVSRRRAPLLDGAFWQFQYRAQWFPTPKALAGVVDAAHAVGLDIIMLYTVIGRDGTFSTVVPDTALPHATHWKGRDPVETILRRADELGMAVYLGDAPPTGFGHRKAEAEDAKVERTLYTYRRQMLGRYGRHKSLVGYYINFECCPAMFGNDATVPAERSEKLARFVKEQLPRLRVVQPVGLYMWRDSDSGPWRHVTPKELPRFWDPYMAAAKHVDVFMVIDGPGTLLSPLSFTNLNQACILGLCDKHGKTMWTDVECAMMGRAVGYRPMAMDQLAASFDVAARHAERLVTFCYFNYMNPLAGRPPARRLYDDYAAYRRAEQRFPESFRPTSVADALSTHLDTAVLPFWTAPERMDCEHGGFLPWTGSVGKKPLIFHLRMLYSHAVALERARDDATRRRLRAQYDEGMAFLEKRFRDSGDGGWLTDVARDGRAADASKRTVGQAYVVYVLGEIASRLGDERAKRLAVDAWTTMDAKAHDAKHGGYVERCDRPMDDPDNAKKSIGTNMHVALALARLEQVAPNASIRARLEELLGILTTQPLVPKSNNTTMYCTRDWRPATADGPSNQQTLYGHSAELVWYMLDVLDVLKKDPARYRPWLDAVAEGVIRNGLMPGGGVYVWGPLDGKGTDPDDIRWWTQNEVMIMLARMHALTGEHRYWVLFERVTRFTFGHFAPSGPGDWTSGWDRKTGKQHPRTSQAWKGGLHTVRCLLECQQTLRSHSDRH